MKKCIVVFSKRRQDYLLARGIEPIEGFTDYYEYTEQLRQCLRDYAIEQCARNFF